MTFPDQQTAARCLELANRANRYPRQLSDQDGGAVLPSCGTVDGSECLLPVTYTLANLQRSPLTREEREELASLLDNATEAEAPHEGPRLARKRAKDGARAAKRAEFGGMSAAALKARLDKPKPPPEPEPQSDPPEVVRIADELAREFELASSAEAIPKAREIYALENPAGAPNDGDG